MAEEKIGEVIKFFSKPWFRIKCKFLSIRNLIIVVLWRVEIRTIILNSLSDMLVISYDISDDKLRNRFAKMLIKNGAIRLQFSVYEVNNTKRVIDNLIIKINMQFMPKFDGGDSVMIFDVNSSNVLKFGNAIHRDKDIVFLWIQMQVCQS